MEQKKHVDADSFTDKTIGKDNQTPEVNQPEAHGMGWPQSP
jgi:hypothetical protein